MARRYIGGRGQSSTPTIDVKPMLKELGIFYNGMKNHFQYFEMASGVLGMYVDSKGDGLYVRAGAKVVKATIQNVIDGKKQINKPTWPALSDAQTGFKNVLPGSHKRPWKMTGKVYNNIVIRKRGKAWEVGLKSKNVPVVGFSYLVSKNDGVLGKPRKKQGSINIITYAMMNEYGMTEDTPARPLFDPAFVHVAGKYGPKMESLVSGALSLVQILYEQETRRTRGSADISDTMSQHTLNAANPDGDFDDKISKKNLNDALTAGSGLQEDTHVARRTAKSKALLSEIDKRLIRLTEDISGAHSIYVGNTLSWLREHVQK